MISEWMVNGSINEFVKAHADADRLKLVCLPSEILILISIDGHTLTVAERCH
jgi:hypothetical protein